MVIWLGFSWWLVRKEQSLPPNIQNRKLISGDELIKVMTGRSQRWDLSPGRKAPGYACLARMLHCLPCALQAWDHAVLYFVLFSQCPERKIGGISLHIECYFQAAGCMMACLCCGHSYVEWTLGGPMFPFCKRLWGILSCFFMFVGASDHRSESHSVVSDSCDPMGYTVHGILQARILEWLFSSPGDLPNPGIEPMSPT